MQTINRTGARVLSDWVARYSDVVAGEGNGSRRENKKRRRRRGRRRRRRRSTFKSDFMYDVLDNMRGVKQTKKNLRVSSKGL